MSDWQTRNNLGDKFKTTIAEAMQTGDFHSLNELVTDTVNDALREADFQANLAKQETRRQVYRKQREWQEKQKAGTKQNVPVSHKQAAPTAPKSSMTSLVKMQRKGSVSGVLYIVFGGIGVGFSTLALLWQLIRVLAGVASIPKVITITVIFVIFLSMIFHGVSLQNRLKRAEEYLRLCGTKMYGVITELARYSRKSVGFVRRDLRKMLKKGMFPEGHLDDKETCFMLNDVIYHQYLETEKEYVRRKQEEENVATASVDEQKETEESPEAELNSMIAEGMDCIRRLRDLNDEIDGEAISAKLYRLEDLLKEIFDRLREHPEQRHRMHKLMDYYLPTMLKLVEQYAEFDEVSAPGQEILEAKTEIERTLDVINQAFVTLLNNLFRDAAFDAAADAQVLQTMLAREGLTREPELVYSDASRNR